MNIFEILNLINKHIKNLIITTNLQYVATFNHVGLLPSEEQTYSR